MHMPNELLSNDKYRAGEIAAALKATYLAIDDRLRLKENAELLEHLKVKSTAEGNNGFGGIDAIEQDAGSGAVPVTKRRDLPSTKAFGNAGSLNCSVCVVQARPVCVR